MSVQIRKAIWFHCEKCKWGQFSFDTLEFNKDSKIREDRIDCQECSYENHVIEPTGEGGK